MLTPFSTNNGSSDEKRLRQLFRDLTPEDKVTLVRFAEFLAANTKPELAPQSVSVFPHPEPIERPAQENVIKAIKRLSATYPMVAREKLLNETSSLVTAHVIHGRAAQEVIDELEAMFANQYHLLKAEFEQATTVCDVAQ